MRRAYVASMHNVGAVSQKFLDYAIEQTIPFLSKEVKSIQIPSQSGDKDSFDYSVKNIHITGASANTAHALLPDHVSYLSRADFSVGSAALSFHAPDGLSLKLTGISLAGHLDWRFCARIFCLCATCSIRLLQT